LSTNEKIKKLVEACSASVEISFNLHRSVYQSVEQYLNVDAAIPDVIDVMVGRDFIIEIQFYPDTPVGFHVVYHYDLDAALDEALTIIEGLKR